MFFYAIEIFLNTNRYKRAIRPTGLFLKITEEFLKLNELEDLKLIEIEKFIDQVLDETPIDEVDKQLILNFSEQ